MKWISALPFIALTVLCWGMYGPVLHRGQEAMEHSRMRPFLMVGFAYFVVGVVVPLIVLNTTGEPGHWNARGILWSFGAGMAGAIGALGIILAFKVGGRPMWVMPLVFGGAPVVSAFLSVFMAGNYRQLGQSPLFLAGLILVSMGAFMVLFFAPKGHPSPADHGSEAAISAPAEPAAASAPQESSS